jgi:competence protein ComEC
VGDLKMKFLRFMLEGCLVSFSAWLGTMGFITYYFRIFSPVTVLANLVIVPLASLITLCGFSLVTAGLVLPALAPWLGHSSESLVLILISLNSLFIKLPGAYFYL